MLLIRIIFLLLLSAILPQTGMAADVPLAPPEKPAIQPSSSPLPSEQETKDFPVGESDIDNEDTDITEDAPAIAAPVETDTKTTQPTPSISDEEESPANNYTNTIILQGLNKITARTSLLEARVGSTIQFGNIEVLVKQCWKSSPEEAPDNKGLLEIWEQKPGEPKIRIFTGWMLASSPGVSSLEHPVYDITVIECTNKEKVKSVAAPAVKK